MSDYILTKKAALDLKEIYHYSLNQWGDIRAKKYLANIYKTFQFIAKNPEIGRLRLHRSAPFLMYPAEKHYVIYSQTEINIVILTVLHSKRDIETIINEICDGLSDEISFILK